MRRTFTLLPFAILVLAPLVHADEVLYQKPPKEVLDILNAPATPALSVNPTKTYASLSQAARYPSIAEVSEPMLRLAGMRIDPRTNGLHLAPHSLSIELVKLPEGTKIKLDAAAERAGGSTALVARWKAVRVLEHHGQRNRAVARRSRHRQDAQDRRRQIERRAGRSHRLAGRQQDDHRENRSRRPRTRARRAARSERSARAGKRRRRGRRRHL